MGDKSMNENTILIQAEITQLKVNLAETDYVAIKIAEGAATADDYADVLVQRQAWRDRINTLEVSAAGADEGEAETA
jgi:hypothetical protein